MKRINSSSFPFSAIAVGFVCLVFGATQLLAASISNEGTAPVRVTGKSTNGVLIDTVLPPGQTKPIRQPFLWVEHVPDGSTQEVKICITENDGTKGYIKSVGGRYTAMEAREKPQPAFLFDQEAPTPLQPGFATNNSNVMLSLKLIRADGSYELQTLMPGNTTGVSQDMVEVQIPEFAIDRPDQSVRVNVVMPDGSRHELRTLKASARINPRQD